MRRGRSPDLALGAFPGCAVAPIRRRNRFIAGRFSHAEERLVNANREPNALARTAADDTARNFDCAKDKVRIVGERGRAIELAGQ